MALRNAGIACLGKEVVPRVGELTTDIVREAIEQAKQVKDWPVGAVSTGTIDVPKLKVQNQSDDLPLRPPQLCRGCPHGGVFNVLKDFDALVMGDIGCYTLGVMPPYEALDSCICMGASIGMLHGFNKAASQLVKKPAGEPVVAVIGDSTFFHSGITPLINMVYNHGRGVVMILDNRTTAMTGHQDHAGTAKTALGDTAPQINLVPLCQALGVSWIKQVDPYQTDELRRILSESLEYDGVAVIITTKPCVLIKQ
jgi:indolepyruvate ferredoxin oxidoreductase alpha subunit